MWRSSHTASGIPSRPATASGSAGSFLELPVRSRESAGDITFDEPEQSEPLGVNVPAALDEPRPERLAVRDVAKGEWRPEVDPLSARTRSGCSIRPHRPEVAWDIPRTAG
ncbi:hypothetical protein QF037_004068 [Streptomyces canus]|nr:hypothetical protein [Streptomyces canus]